MVHWEPWVSEGIFPCIASKEASIKGFHLFGCTITKDFTLVEVDLEPR